MLSHSFPGLSGVVMSALIHRASIDRRGIDIFYGVGTSDVL